MSNVNFSTTTPAAPSGTINTAFQTDGANVSANVPIASASIAGLVKQGSGLTIASDGTLSLAGSAWANWTPTVSIAGGGTVTLGSIDTAEYFNLGPATFVHLQIKVTLSGTLSFTSSVAATLPVGFVGTQAMPFAATAFPLGSAAVVVNGQIDPGGIHFGVGSLATGVQQTLLAGGFYRNA